MSKQDRTSYWKKYHHDWYMKNREKRLAQQADRRKANLERLWFLKESTPCADCGQRFHPICMDFDHLGDKSFTISHHTNFKWDNIASEIEKCEIVCSNCHRLRTHQRRFAGTVTDGSAKT